MNLFKKEAAVDEPPITCGVMVLRKTLHAWNRSPNAMALIASEIEGVGVSTLEAFAAGKADLSVEALKALTKVLYPHGEFDLESGILRSANRAEPKPAYTALPPSVDPSTCPKFTGGPAPAHKEGIPPLRPPQPKKRAGWL